VARNEAILNLGRADVDTLHVLDLAAAVDATAARFAHQIVVAQAGDQFALEFAAWMQLDRIINRLVRDRFVGVVRPHGTQYVGNLLRRPEFLQVVPYYLEERTINVKLGRAARRDAPRAALQVSKVRIISARPGCAPQFATDRTGSGQGVWQWIGYRIGRRTSSSRRRAPVSSGGYRFSAWQHLTAKGVALDFRGCPNCRIRVGEAAQNFAILRRIALNLLKSEKTTKLGVATKRLKAGWNAAYLAKVLGMAT
jgi:hypothetical protein